MYRLIALIIVVAGVYLGQGCSIDSQITALIPPAQAAVLESDAKNCTRDMECRAINEDCCGQESGIVVVNRMSVPRLAGRIAEDCKKKMAAATPPGSLCKDKKPLARLKYPKVVCENNLCIAKALPSDAEKAAVETAKTECSYDAECVIFDADCCNNHANLIAINFKAENSERLKKMKECRVKLAADKRMCNRDNKLFRHSKIVKCQEKKCTLI